MTPASASTTSALADMLSQPIAPPVSHLGGGDGSDARAVLARSLAPVTGSAGSSSPIEVSNPTNAVPLPSAPAPFAFAPRFGAHAEETSATGVADERPRAISPPAASRTTLFATSFGASLETEPDTRWAETTTDDRLRVLVITAHVPPRYRSAALGELVARGTPDAAALVTQGLAGRKLHPVWLDGLLHAADQLASGPDAALCAALLSTARALKSGTQAGSPPHLPLALRALGRLLGAEESTALLEFVRPGERAEVKQASLFALQTVFGTTPTAAPPPVEARLHELAVCHANAEWLTSGENVALAGEAIAAALLASALSTDDATALVAATGSSSLAKSLGLILRGTPRGRAEELRAFLSAMRERARG